MNRKDLFSNLHSFGAKPNKVSYPKPEKEIKQEKAGKPLKTQRINQVSDKRKEENKIYLKVRQEFLDAHPRCEVYPNIKSQDIHHRKGRIGKLLTDTTYFMAVSRKAHREIELNPQWARENGYTLNRFKK